MGDFRRTMELVDTEARKRRAALGILPRSYAHKIPFIHAHSFVYTVDSFGKFLDVLWSYSGLPEGVAALRDEFYERLPTVRKIRNSALHIEDRSRGYGSWKDAERGRKMELREGFLGLSNLEGNQLCYTIDDGSYQRIEVSCNTLHVLVELLNRLLTVFTWKGSPRVEPSY